RRYDNFREVCFQIWAEKHARKFCICLRAMVVHDGLRNWYYDQWNEYVEKPFFKNYSEFFDSTDPDTLFKLLDQYPEAIEEHYPKPLLIMIKHESNAVNERTGSRTHQNA